jgi:hypothetical protein
MPRPGLALLGSRQPNRQLPFMCMSGRQVEEIELTFAEGLPLPQPIAARKIVNRAFSFVATAQLEDRTLTIRREFEVHVPGQICAAQLEGDIARAMQDVIASLRTGLTFEVPPPSSPIEAVMGERQADAGAAKGPAN